MKSTGEADKGRGARSVGAGAATGVLAAAAALGAGELAAGLTGTASPVIVVGDALVDNSPSWAKEFAIAVFGIYDKIALLAGVYAAIALFAAVLGVLSLRRPVVGYTGLAAFAAVGAVAVAVRRADEPMAVVPVVVGALAGEAALVLLLRAVRGGRPAGSPVAGVGGTRRGRPAGAPQGVSSRRRFLLTGAGVLVFAGAAGGIGRYLASGAGIAEKRAALRLPPAADPLPPLPAGSDLGLRGLPPFTTPNPVFYRIDTALSVPRVDPDRWRLRIHGMVDRPLELDYDALLRRRLVESDTTLTCVSNQVGGDLVGNTRWLGVRLDDLLREAGVHSGADQILSTSQDGWTCGTPTEAVLDGRDALLAIAMDGEPLPFAHGFPVRMVVPGLYGFVSATKWVTDIRLTRFSDARAYWARRGWAVRAPIKTMSRIDVPGPLAEVDAGPTTVAGTAWAQRRGIEAVEVRADGGPWREADLAEVPGIDTWVQWSTEFDLEPGRHAFEVRATDNSGYTQTEERAEPVPDGATGWHSVQITTV
ncbi:molybdopterin-dependent oxidoreductase [Nocardiopsis suaedae]|uniref:Molybdopterin-dependent oxidoreductase n=1 Tax=Nocardiopsis suaedae TaxID=3018444 RepID=A0ABT4TV99_9ACTN|nr:molybdopterin-dependent oxidoreductase [Nocardiopsis suaedae]MDA2808630.1 molybdopterin-dependent oxidoreductase [Nocardiopsis suaedae]